jgi:hypothetical protein
VAGERQGQPVSISVTSVPPLGNHKKNPLSVRCREISTKDIMNVTDLLTKGFASPRLKHLFLRRSRSPTREFWANAFRRLSDFPTPPGFPRYGYLLECAGTVVGVILVIASVVDSEGHRNIRCSLSSWYVEPAFRCYAPMLASRILRNPEATYINITPSHRTLGMLKAQGFSQYCGGRFISFPILSHRPHANDVEVRAVVAGNPNHTSCPEAELLLEHAEYGCISAVCYWQGQECPFVFLPLREVGMIPFAYLAYCRSVPDFVALANPLGRFLISHGIPLVVLDANGPVTGLVGKYIANSPKFYKGSHPPRLGDIAYSERVMFGF